MALKLHIPPCICTPAHPFHLPPWEKPLRIQIGGSPASIEQLLPDVPLIIGRPDTMVFPQSVGPELAKLTYQALYGRAASDQVPGDFVIRDEYLGWERPKIPGPLTCIRHYAVTFDHLVPADDVDDPETLAINIIDIDDDAGAEANKWLLFTVDPADYTGKKVLAVPRCCQVRKGTTDRLRINVEVAIREGRLHESKYKDYNRPESARPPRSVPTSLG